MRVMSWVEEQALRKQGWDPFVDEFGQPLKRGPGDPPVGMYRRLPQKEQKNEAGEDGAEKVRRAADRLLKSKCRKLTKRLAEQAERGDLSSLKLLVALAKTDPKAKKPTKPLPSIALRLASDPPWTRPDFDEDEPDLFYVDPKDGVPPSELRAKEEAEMRAKEEEEARESGETGATAKVEEASGGKKEEDDFWKWG